MDTNLKGMFLCGTGVARAMIPKRQGKIVNMSSIFGQRVWPNASIYAISKGAINQMTRAWAVEWGKYNISVNVLSPSFIITSLNKHLLEQEEYRERVMRNLPIGRIGEIADILGPAIFLASDASNYMTGHVLNVDGGWTCL
jgi:2-deoxy-D-gluconate 3-dehydrogenase